MWPPPPAFVRNGNAPRSLAPWLPIGGGYVPVSALELKHIVMQAELFAVQDLEEFSGTFVILCFVLAVRREGRRRRAPRGEIGDRPVRHGRVPAMLLDQDALRRHVRWSRRRSLRRRQGARGRAQLCCRGQCQVPLDSR